MATTVAAFEEPNAVRTAYEHLVDGNVDLGLKAAKNICKATANTLKVANPGSVHTARLDSIARSITPVRNGIALVSAPLTFADMVRDAKNGKTLKAVAGAFATGYNATCGVDFVNHCTGDTLLPTKVEVYNGAANIAFGGIASGFGIADGVKTIVDANKKTVEPAADDATEQTKEIADRKLEKISQDKKVGWTKIVKNVMNVALSVLAGLALFAGLALNSWLMVGLSVVAVVTAIVGHVHKSNANALQDRVELLEAHEAGRAAAAA